MKIGPPVKGSGTAANEGTARPGAKTAPPPSPSGTAPADHFEKTKGGAFLSSLRSDAAPSGKSAQDSAASPSADASQERASARRKGVEERIQYLRQIGVGSVLTEDEIAAADDDTKLKDLLDLAAAGSLVGAKPELVDAVKDQYLRKPDKQAKRDALFDLVARSQDVPIESAKRAGIREAKQLVSLSANLALLGEQNPNGRLADSKTYDTIREKGVNGLLAETFLRNNGVSEVAKGLSLKRLLNGAAAAQDLGLDVGKREVWEKIRSEGVPGLYRDNLITKRGIPRDAVKGLSLEELTRGIKEAGGDRSKVKDAKYWEKIAEAKNRKKGEHGDGAETPGGHRPGGRAPLEKEGGVAMSPIVRSGRHDRSERKGPSRDVLNPLPGTASSSGTPPHQTHAKNEQKSSSSSSQRTQGSAGERERSRAVDRAPVGGGRTGTPTGNARHGGDPRASTGGTSTEGGAANAAHGGAGAAGQTGAGVGAEHGKPADSGAVNTVLSAERNQDGSITYTWMRSGGSDGREGIYQTTYTQGGDGTWSYTVTNAVTGAVVNSGEGEPPDTSIVGSSSQEVADDGTMTFAAGDDDPEDDSEGKPVDPVAGGGSRPSTIHVSQIGAGGPNADDPVDPSPLASFRPSVIFVGDVVAPDDGVTDPAKEAKGTRRTGTVRAHDDGRTDPAENESGGRKGPVPAGEQPKQPSRAEGGSAPHRSRRDSGHGGGGQRR